MDKPSPHHVKLAALTLAELLVAEDVSSVRINLTNMKDEDGEHVGDIEVIVRYAKPATAEEGEVSNG